MCDDVTEAENAVLLSRRKFHALGAGALVAAALPGCATAAVDTQAASTPIAERAVSITTPDGSADGFFAHPVSGRHPAVIMWPDVAGLREAYRVLARKLAQDGFAVLAVNHYYRSAKAPIVERFEQWQTPAAKAKLGPAREALTPETIGRDAAAFVAWLDAQKEVDPARGIGTSGYCMTGPYTIRAAAAAPERVKAAASFHGGGLVEDGPDSPHLLIPGTQASYLFAIAQNDDAREPKTKEVLRRTCEEAARSAVIEVFPAQHGWCTPDSPVYDAEQEARAWQMMLAMFRRM